MNILTTLIAGAAVLAAPFACADLPEAARSADVVVVGEFHDNPVHHDTEAALVRELAPSAVVYEMLTEDEANRLSGMPSDPGAMRQAVADNFHWSNIADYAGVLAVSPRIVGAALPRDAVRSAFERGAAAVFGAEAATYGLTDALPPEQLETRLALQFDAHCETMPIGMMGGMVEAQRLRDAAFARAVLATLDRHGPPVVLITGNGHARKDWGVPAVLSRLRPDLTVVSIAQGEDGAAPAGGFDTVLDAPRAARPDPCAAFR